jgi:phospholipid transport system substrate-binding protein
MLRETPSAQLANTDRLRDQVLPLLSEYADFTRMSRLVLGKHWRRATPAQRAKFTEQFVLVMVRFYAASLRGILQSAPNHAIAIDVLPAQITPDTKRVLVRSRVEIGQERPLQVTYHLYRTSDAWKIYDMAIEGISIVANYRANFASEIRVSGLDGLIRRLEERNAAVRTAFVFSR